MTTFTYVPGASNAANWSDAATWGGVVPNAPDADVLIAAPSSASKPTYYSVDIGFGQTYSVRSLVDGPNASLNLAGTLSVAGAAVIQSSIYAYGPSFSAGSLQIGKGATFFAAPTKLTAGDGTNAGTLYLVSSTATFGSFQNTGTVETAGGAADTLAVTGGTGPIVNGALTGGTYQASQGNTLRINDGGVITTDAATINLGQTAFLTTSDILSFDPVSGTYRPLESTLTSIAAGGTLVLTGDIYAGTAALAVAGTLTLSAGSTFSDASLTVLAGGQVTGLGTITAPVVNNGVLGATALLSDLSTFANAGSLVVHGAISGTGTLQVGGSLHDPTFPAVVLELDGAVSEGVAFQGSTGTLLLDQPASFSGSIGGFSGHDSIVVAKAPYTAVTGYSYAGDTAGGVLTVNQGASSLALAFTGNYTTANFALGAGPQSSSLAITAVGVGGGTSGPSAPGGSTVVIGGATSYFGSGPLVGFVDGVNHNSVTGGLATIGAGGPGYLQWQFINAGADDIAISTQAPNVFLHSGSGNDALQVASGTNVLDGGLGSNFLTGGTGTDTFFTDARAPGAVWNTLRNFHAGDAATLWGFTAGVSSYSWDAAVAGAPGSQGATLRANIVGGAGRTGNGIDASITFAGLSVAQAQSLQIVTGTVASGNYLYISNPGA